MSFGLPSPWKNKIHSTRLSLALTSPYNIYYKAVVALQILPSWLHLGVSSPCICGILQLSQFTEVLKYFSLRIDLSSVPVACMCNKWYGWGSSSRYHVCLLCCPFLDICSHNVLAPCNWNTAPCYCPSSFEVSLRLGALWLPFLHIPL
jgi:hypothetical protein